MLNQTEGGQKGTNKENIFPWEDTVNILLLLPMPSCLEWAIAFSQNLFNLSSGQSLSMIVNYDS